MRDEQLPEIPVFRPDMTEAEIAAVAEVMRSGWIGAGPKAAELEARFAERVGAPHAVSVSSGTAALQAALFALGVEPGDEIILPSFTWVSGFQAIRAFGAVPVFADVEPKHLTLDVEDVRRLVGPRTRGIIAIHHGGHLADIPALAALAAQRGLWLLDDGAHACGAAYGGTPVGSLCEITCFSFNAMKNLATADGGMVVTRNAQLAERARRFRSLGIDRDTFARYGTDTPARWRYDVTGPGLRLALNDILAAIGLVQLSRLDEMNGKRGRLVARYREAFDALPGVRMIRPRANTTPSFHMATLLLPGRDAFIEAMRRKRVSIGVHYIPTHLFSFAEPWHRVLPVTERIWREVVTLPLYPAMTHEEQDRVIAAVHSLAATRETASAP